MFIECIRKSSIMGIDSIMMEEFNKESQLFKQRVLKVFFDSEKIT